MSKKLKISVFLFMLVGMFVFLGGFIDAKDIKISYHLGDPTKPSEYGGGCLYEEVRGTETNTVKTLDAVKGLSTKTNEKNKLAGYLDAGYVADGWKLQQDGKTYAAGTDVSALEGDLHFAINWKAAYAVKIAGEAVASKAVDNGTIAVSTNKVAEGGSCVVTLTPATGYEVDTFTVAGTPVDVTSLTKSGNSFTYTISNISAETNVVATYKIKVFDITLEGNEGVTLALVGESKVNYGDSRTVTVEIAKGYTLDTATINGANAVINEDKIELSNITTNITIKVFATKDTYVVLEGKDQKINLNKTDVLVVRFSGDADLFVGLRINGKVVPEDKYTVKSGSTIVELDPEYVDSLKNGKYIIEAVYANGNSAKTTFTIERLSNPDTGDGIGIYMVAVIASVMGVALVVKAKRNKRANNI